MHPSSLSEGILIGLPNIDSVGKRNGLRRRTARTRGSAREVKQKAKEREHWAEPRWSMWAAALLEKVGRNSMAGLRWAQYIVQAPQLPKAQGKVGWTGCGQGIAWRVGTQRLLFFMYLLTRRWLDYSSTPICRSPMWDHYGRNDCIRACEHGCLKRISLGPFVVVDLFVFPLHLLFHIYSIFLYPHSSSHTSSALPWLSFLPSQVFFNIQTYTNWSYWTYVVDQAATPSPLQRAGIPGLWPIGGLEFRHLTFSQYSTPRPCKNTTVSQERIGFCTCWFQQITFFQSRPPFRIWFVLSIPFQMQSISVYVQFPRPYRNFHTVAALRGWILQVRRTQLHRSAAESPDLKYEASLQYLAEYNLVQ